MPSRSTTAPSLGGRSVFRQGNAGIPSMASSLGGRSASETVFTAEQVGGDARQRRDRLPKTAGRCRAPLASCLGGLVGDGEGAAYVAAGRGVILAVF